MDCRFEYDEVRVDGPDGPIVAGFSAQIPVDGITALVGASGAGKTTLLRLLNRLDDPDGGEVRYCGRNVADYEVLDLRRRVQYVSQVPMALPGTVADNLKVGGHRHTLGHQEHDSGSATRLLARVGLDPGLADRIAERLSVGEAQRMCLARALARHPECLLLDEPTSALDAESKGGIERLVRSLADDGLTVVIVTHDAFQANELADQSISVGNGVGNEDQP